MRLSFSKRLSSLFVLNSDACRPPSCRTFFAFGGPCLSGANWHALHFRCGRLILIRRVGRHWFWVLLPKQKDLVCRGETRQLSNMAIISMNKIMPLDNRGTLKDYGFCRCTYTFSNLSDLKTPILQNGSESAGYCHETCVIDQDIREPAGKLQFPKNILVRIYIPGRSASPNARRKIERIPI